MKAGQLKAEFKCEQWAAVLLLCLLPEMQFGSLYQDRQRKPIQAPIRPTAEDHDNAISFSLLRLRMEGSGLLLRVFQFSAQETPAKQMASRNEAENEVSSNKRPRAEGDRIAAAPSSVSFKSKLMNSSNPDLWVGFGAGREKLKINPGDF
ncbi:hypothetical protein ACOSQ3_025173 [Xanthoceras sorbifolium]